MGSLSRGWNRGLHAYDARQDCMHQVETVHALSNSPRRRKDRHELMCCSCCAPLVAMHPCWA